MSSSSSTGTSTATSSSASSTATSGDVSVILPLYETCPPGLGGANCTEASCDSPYVAPASRTLKNATAEECSSCTNGFTGLNCNVCSSTIANSCELAAAATDRIPADGDDLVCYNQPNPLSTSYYQCDVDQVTLSSLFPGELKMTLIITLEPDNTTETGLYPWSQSAGTSYSSVWLDGVEQFYCQATGCSGANSTEAVDAAKSGSSNSTIGDNTWTCTSLECSCISGTRMCGGTSVGGIDLGSVINSISGSLSMPCSYLDPTNSSAVGTCAFQGEQLNSFLGDAGLPLTNCVYGSCVSRNQLDVFYAEQYNLVETSTATPEKLSGQVIGGIAVLCVVVAALVAFLLWGLFARYKAGQKPRKQVADLPVGLKWDKLDYWVSSQGKLGSKMKQFGQKSGQGDLEKDSGDSGNLSDPQLGSASALPLASLAARSQTRRHILRGVSGSVSPGNLVAILGPSGSGKTTLSELLAGRDKRGSMAGSVNLLMRASEAAQDGNETDATDLNAAASGRRLFAFVDQDDQLPAHSTVREALYFAAELSLPENVPSCEKESIVDSTMQTLGLQGVANSIIGSRARRGVSGGERRRVSLGIALVARPRILVLDEPLSGLDAFNAARVIRALRALAHTGVGGTTVLLTIHQPSSDIFYMMDKAILLVDGKVFYDGTPDEALDWCSRQGRPCALGHNVADHLMDLAFREDTAASRSSKSGEHADEKAPEAAVAAGDTAQRQDSSQPKRHFEVVTADRGQVRPITTWFTQSLALSKRYLLTARRDSAGPLAHLLVHVSVGLLAGGVFYHVKLTIGGFQNRIGSIYFLFMLMMFGSLSAITLMSQVRALMVRERADAFYSPFAWLAAHVAYDLVLLRIIPGLLLEIIMYWMVGLKDTAKDFFEYLLISTVFYIVTALYMMLLSAIFSDLNISVLAGGAYILFNIGMGGFLLNLDTLSGVVRWIQWICPLKYALQAVTLNEIVGLSIEDSLGGVPFDVPASEIAESLFDLTGGSYYVDLLALALGWCLGFALLLAVAVWWRMRDRR